MKILNLQEGFDPFNATPEELISFESFTFKGGEPHIKIDTLELLEDEVLISARINSFNDLGLFIVTVNAIRNFDSNIKISAMVPYFPGARQDRVMVPGEPFTVKIYADIINNLQLDTVYVFDTHSDVTAALVDNIEIISNHRFINKVVNDIIYKNSKYTNQKINIISPDAGANKKILKVAQAVKWQNNIIKCDKTRDITTGDITNFEVYANNEALLKRINIIVDDICDGGGTFIGLAKALIKKGADPDRLYLAVSHGIFSQEFKKLDNYFDMVYTTDSIKNYGKEFLMDFQYHKGYTPKLKEIKLNLL